MPVVVDADHNGKIDIIPERQAYLLFDRMVAYHIMNGIPVPIDATDFYKGLEGRDISAFLGSARVKEGRRADKRFKNNKAVRKRS